MATEFQITRQADQTFAVEEWDDGNLVMQVPGFPSETDAQTWIAERERIDRERSLDAE